MRGSIAIWHDTLPIDADGYAPRVEVHINIWRNDQRKKPNHFDLFDIGFRFEELRALRSLSISLPFVVPHEHVSDLFDVMHDPYTLSAIFNETLTPGSMRDSGNCFAASHTESKKVQLYVWRCPDKERQLSMIGEGRDSGTVINISDQFFDRLRPNVGDHYFRLRIKVPIGIDNGFVSSNDPKDSAFLSTISTSEIVEFRLNERRNFSNAIRNRLEAKDCSLIDISAVHYFLIRDMGVEMTQSHTAFRKMRRLEPVIWARYLAQCPGFNPDKMIIYHWASFSVSATAVVDSFTALATFRAYYTGKLWVYALVIVGFGAMGSAAQAVLANGLVMFLGTFCSWCGPTSANLLLIALIAVALAFWVIFRRQRT